MLPDLLLLTCAGVQLHVFHKHGLTVDYAVTAHRQGRSACVVSIAR